MRKQTANPELQNNLQTWIKELDQRPSDSGTAVEYRCTLVTPMYGGGVQAGIVDQAMPIRATSIRGQLRHWWRFLYQQRYNAEHPDQPISSAELFAAERAIWGGLGKASRVDADDDALAKSRVVVRVVARNGKAVELLQTQTKSLNANGKIAFHWTRTHHDGARYALFPAQGQTDLSKLNVLKDPAELLQSNFVFHLHVALKAKPDDNSAQDRVDDSARNSIDNSTWNSVLEAVQWWAHFGGVGARTRRGLGAVQVRDSSGNLLPMPTEAEVAAVGCALTLVRYGDGGNPLPAWEAVVECLRQLRQGVGIARKPGPPKGTPPRPTPGRSYWPEPDSIRRLTGQYARTHAPDPHKPTAFPRAMFGLPIITHFIKDGGQHTDHDPQDTELLPKPPGADQPATRLASPLLLRPMCRDDVWYAGALLLPLDAVRSMGLVLHKKNREKSVVARLDAHEWWGRAFAAQFDLLKGHADPIAAYLGRLRAGGMPADALADAPLAPNPAINEELTLHRPRLKRNNANGSLTIEPRDGQRPIVLIGPEAQRCFDALSASAQRHLRESRYPPFNRLTIIVAGIRFVSLEEYPQ